MKNSGGRDTFLLFIVLLLALGAVCWLCVIQKNVDKLNDVKDELRTVEQEKARNDAIIQQAQQLDQEYHWGAHRPEQDVSGACDIDDAGHDVVHPAILS